MQQDTIAAIATAPGQGGVGIVRLSGADSERILLQVFQPAGKHALPLQSHLLTFGWLMDGEEKADECMAVLMRAPRSYTREDVAELQLHGSHSLCQKALELCMSAGARLAEPGEFTRRAFMNGRIDLSQAEAVMAMIASTGELSRRAAMRQLQGGAGQFIRGAQDELYQLQAGAAACIDYPEEISEEEAVDMLAPQLRALADKLENACDERASRLISAGLQVALCGRPNVGKSSLMNALLGEERAIVTNIPGTTRDTVHGSMTLGGCVIHLTDTAGMRETDDPVEAIGVSRSEKAMDEADLVLCVLDASEPFTPEDERLLQKLEPAKTVIVLNKNDLPAVLQAERFDGMKTLSVSADRPETLTGLKAELRKRAEVTDLLPLQQPRHMEAARRAASAMRQTADALDNGMPVDLAAVDMHMAAAALGEITGDQVDERLLDRVFSTFCVGK